MAQPGSSARSTFLMVFLLFMFAAACLLVCVGMFGQLAFAILAVVGVIGGIGMFHYLLWGRSLSREMEAERGREVAEEDIYPDSNGWPTDGPSGHRQF